MNSKPNRDLWLLAGVSALGFGLRVIGLGLRSISLDESYSLALIKLGLPAILKSAAHDIHPPLFYILLSGWTHIFGPGLLTARLLTSLFSALLIPVAFFLARLWLDRRGTWWVVGLVVSSPYFMELGRWSRMYSLTALWGGLSLLFFWQVFQREKNNWPLLAYTLVTLAAVYTHYFAFLVLLCEYVFLILLYGLNDREWFQGKAFIKWLAAQAAILLGFMPWLFIFMQQFFKKIAPYPDTRLFQIWDTPALFYYFLIGSYNRLFLSKILTVALLSTAGFILAGGFFRSRRTFTGAFEKRVWLWLLIVLFVPVLATVLYSLKGSNVVDRRYLQFSALALLILLGGTFSRLSLRSAVAAGSLFIIAFLFPLQSLWFNYGRTENWGAVAALIKSGKTPDDLLIFQGYCQVPLKYYLPGDNPILSLPGEADIVNLKWSNPIPITLSELVKRNQWLQPYKGAWLVFGDKYEKDQGLVVKQWLTARYGQPKEYAFDYVWVYRFAQAQLTLPREPQVPLALSLRRQLLSLSELGTSVPKPPNHHLDDSSN